MSSHENLRRIGTLSQILAWVLLVIGVVAAIGLWMTLNGLSQTITAIPGSIALVGAVPSLLFGIGNFLQFFVLGKVLHLLVDVEGTTQQISQEMRKQAASSKA